MIKMSYQDGGTKGKLIGLPIEIRLFLAELKKYIFGFTKQKGSDKMNYYPDILLLERNQRASAFNDDVTFNYNCENYIINKMY